MNVSLAKKILKLTPKHILDPSKGSPTLSTPLPLSSGATIPAVGLATWRTESEPDQIRDAVLLAIKSGYRHFDTTSRNEAEVGAAIKKAVAQGDVERKDLFVTVRLGTVGDFRVQDTIDTSLKNIGLDYVDLLIMDDNKSEFLETWRVLEKLPATNRTKAVGVANFTVASMEKLLSSHVSLPAVNQVTSNPYEDNNDIIQLCHDKIIHVTAFSPFRSETQGSLFNHEDVAKMAEKHSVVPENVLLSWHIARGNSVLVQDVILGGSEENRKLVILDDEDLAILDGIANQDPQG